jgi:hypothetical protein
VLWRIGCRPSDLAFSSIAVDDPAPESVMNGVIGFLQQGSGVLSYDLFRAIGVPAMREGMTISLP